MGSALRHEAESFAAVTLTVDPAWEPLRLAVASGLALEAYYEQPSENFAAAALGKVSEQAAGNAEETFELVGALWRRGRIVWEGPARTLPGPWFGGLAFDLSRPPSEHWAGFPVSRWILPEVLIARVDGEVTLTAFAPFDPSTPLAKLQQALGERLRGLIERLTRPVAVASVPHAVAQDGSRKEWETELAAALGTLSQGRLEKVVAARAIEVRADAPYNPAALVEAFRRAAPTCATFLIASPGGAYFIGATPERLFHFEDGTVRTAALGGSRIASTTGDWPGDKDLREHRAIVEGISHGLRPLCETLEVADRPHERRMPGGLGHLETPVHGKLKPAVGPAELLRALHPTPAVGGAPQVRALAFLREYEPLERGWYAGVVGFLGEGKAEFRVALRCALVAGDRARVFVGAGIVRGSDPASEWRETAAKAQVPLAALGVQAGVADAR